MLATATAIGSGSPAIGAFVFLGIMFAWIALLLIAASRHNRTFDANRNR